MHYGRIAALIGVALGIVGLAMPGLTSDGEEAMPAINQANPDFPDGIPTIWGGLDGWVQVLVVIVLVVVVALAFRPPLKRPEDRISALTTTVLGVVFLAYAVVKYLDTVDDADAVEAGFAQAFELGLIPAAFTASAGVGFIVVFIGTGLVAIGGLLGFMAATKDDDAPAAPAEGEAAA